MGGSGLRKPPSEWRDALAPSSLLRVDMPPESSEDGYPWALQRWDEKRRRWEWVIVGIVPLRRTEDDLAHDAIEHGVTHPARYVWVRHWTPARNGRARGWRACLDVRKTIGPVEPRRD